MVFVIQEPKLAASSRFELPTTVPAASVWDFSGEETGEPFRSSHRYVNTGVRTLDSSYRSRSTSLSDRYSNTHAKGKLLENRSGTRNVALGAVFGTALFLGTLLFGLTGPADGIAAPDDAEAGETVSHVQAAY